MQEIKSKTIFGIIWRLSERFLAQLISFIVSIVLARILLPEEYGIVALVTVFITIADAFVTNGMGTSLIQKKGSDELDFSTMFHASVIMSMMLYGILFIVAPIIANWYSNPDLTLVIRVMGTRLPIAAINSIQQAYVAKKMIYKKFFFATLIGTIISGAIGIAVAVLGYGVWALVAQYLTNSIIDTIMLFITVDWKPKLKFSIDRFKELFSFGWKVMASSVLGTIFDQLKGLIIGLKYTTTDLAYYNKGEQIPSLLYNNINSTFESVLFPAIAKIQDNKSTVKSVLRRITKNISYIIIPLMLGLAVVAEPLIKFILTDKWLICVPYLRIVCMQQCISILSNINLQAIKAIGRSDILLRLEFIKKPLFLMFILVAMQISPLAIVIGNLLYGIIALVINAVPNKKMLNYSLKEQVHDILPYLGISLIMVIICYSIQFLNLSTILTLILQVIVGIISYLLLSIIFKVEELYYILDIFKKTSIYSKLKKMIAKFFKLGIFKVNNKKIVFDNFSGKGYGCNPKYIAEEIIRQGLNYDLVWLVNDMNEEMPKQIRKVKHSSLKALYELATAKIWIDNVRNYKGVEKKKEQYYIQTWHGAIGFKAIEGDVEDTLDKQYVKEAKYDGTITDLLITNNKEQEKYMRKYFWYNGEILCCGTPRCDILYNPTKEIKEKVYDYFNIEECKKIVLYAPTFRKIENFEVYKFNYNKCCEALKERFGNDFVMLIRLHPNLSNYSGYIQYSDNIKNANNYPDVQEIMSVADVVISDYSSINFEVGLVHKPAFIIAKDLKEYTSNDRKFIYQMDEIPFDIATQEEKLYQNILNFSQEEYEKKCEEFYSKIGIVNNRNASKTIVEIIKNKVKGEKNGF